MVEDVGKVMIGLIFSLLAKQIISPIPHQYFFVEVSNIFNFPIG
jgi:hypothetical protein